MKLSTRRADDFLMAALFLQMIFLPKIWMGIKIIFLAFILLFYLDKIKKKMKIDVGIKLVLIYAFLNLIWIIIGCMRGYETTAIRLGTVDVLWPLVYAVLAFGGLEEYQLKWLYRAIIIAAFILVVSDIALIIAAFTPNKGIMDFLSLFNKNALVAEWTRGYMEIRTDHENYYAFLPPFMMAVFLQKSDKEIGINSIFAKVTAILSMIMAVLMGLGSVWLANAVGLLLCMKKFHIFKKKWVLTVLCFIVPGIIIVLAKSYLEEGFVFYMWQDVLTRLNMTSAVRNINGSTRSAQIHAMLEAWSDNPLIGQGRGVPITYFRNGAYVTRSDNEIVYLITLYQKGLTGFILFFSLVGYAIYILKKRRDIKWFTDPFMIGLICYLTANIFNPYLTNFSNLWILFLPFVIGCKQNTQNRHTNHTALEAL